ncbi:uncharacterized protein LOC122505810 isoform X1 [Leptopilina heterotoma]|uniref:uncharacterized protein LOC122505810 isoform X1 n=1 Tax=Leptopilina heterotoma TaxID=63436 RepID=UPI001CA9DD90|nr:uncharacterized protein LOC122505810 isoform X1 [Leptopilina heterotoma]
MPNCFQCNVGSFFPSIQALWIHYKITHNMSTASSFMCAEPDCLFKKTFSSWSRIRKHYKCYHKFCNNFVNNLQIENNEPIGIELPVNDIQNVNHEQPEPIDNEIDIVNDPVENENQQLFPQFLTHEASKLLAKFYSRPSFPRSLVQLMVDNVGDFMSSSLQQFRKKCEIVLNNSTLQENEKNEIHKLIDEFDNPFSSLSSEYLRLKYFEKSGHLISAVDYKVGERIEYKFKNGRIVRESVDCIAKHIPMRLILKKFLELPGNFEIISKYMNELKRSETEICNFIQGNLWKEKSAIYELENKIVLPIFLGIDDFEINNPLGSHTGVSEVGSVYLSMPFLPPEFYSRLENIFLIGLYYSRDRQLPNGNYHIFKIIVEELNFLAREGILINTASGIQRVYFLLGLILGDNKGLNEVLGFSGSFSANYFCRFCTRHKSNCAKDISEQCNFLRNPVDYERDINNGFDVSGVKEKSIWLDVDHFHPYKNFAVCTLHDFDEGISSYAMPLICQYFILKQKIFDLDFLNERILGFNYQVNGFSNKPCIITVDNLKNLQFRMSGNEMRTFVLCFHFLVGDYVPFDNDVWKYYLVLRRLIEFISCRIFPRNRVLQFQELIKEHNYLYQKQFGSLKPKMHILNHYFKILIESGPLSFLSTIRNEGKHKEVKDSASATRSRKNVTHTLALKQQLQLCYRFLSEEGLKTDLMSGRCQILYNIMLLEGYQYFSNTLPGSFINNACVSVKWVTFNGITYREEMCIILDLCDNGILPTFGIIKKILFNSNANEVCFICLKLSNLGFDSNMGAYEIEYDLQWQCCLINNLLSPFPAIKVVLSNGKKYVGLRCLV